MLASPNAPLARMTNQEPVSADRSDVAVLRAKQGSVDTTAATALARVNSLHTAETFSRETPKGETAREREAIKWIDSGSCARTNRHQSGVDSRWIPESGRDPAAPEMCGFAMTKRLPNNAVKTFSDTAPETVFPVQMPAERDGKTLSASR